MAPRGGVAKSGGALPKLHILCPKTAFFGTKQPRNPVKRDKRRETVATLHVRPNCLVTKSPFLPSSSTICPRNSPKMAKNGPNVRCLCQTCPKPRTGRILGYVAQNRIPRGPIPPPPPTFCGFEASESPNETPRPPYQWSLGRAGGQHSLRTVGANSGSTGVPGAKKMIFFKVVPRPLGMLKQVLLGRFELVVARYGPWKIPKCLENGPFQDQKWGKNGLKTHFSKSDPGPFGVLKQLFLAHFEPVVTRFGPWTGAVLGPKKGEKCVKNVFFQK